MPVFLFLNLFLALQITDFQEAVLYLSGASDISEINQGDYENYEYYYRHPLALNRCNRQRLNASGLFSSYQTEVILDYRSRNGDILSVNELGLLDGFGADAARYLGLFLSFESSGLSPGSLAGSDAPPGSGQKPRIVTADGEAASYIYGKATDLKDIGGSWQAKWAARAHNDVHTPWGDAGAHFGAKAEWGKKPELAYNLSYSGNRYLSTVVAGHFNARFAQGLTQWSGAVIDSWANPSSLMRRASGVSAYKGWSPSYAKFGAALRVDVDRFSLSAFLDTTKLTLGGNLAWNHRNGSIGLTATGTLRDNAAPAPKAPDGNKVLSRMNFSADFQHTFRGGRVLYGEFAWAENVFKAIAGTRMSFGDFDLALRTSYTPYEHNVVGVAGLQRYGRHSTHNASLALSASYFQRPKGQTPHGALQYRLQGNYNLSRDDGWAFATRANVKLRRLSSFADSTAKYAKSWSLSKYELRQDVKWTDGSWLANLRLHGLYGDTFAMLGALEGGYLLAGSSFSCNTYLQLSFFRVDDWDDRIYIYQRDAPGNYNVPAMYGRGYMLSAYSNFKFGRYLKLYFRISYLSYPWARPTDTRKKDSLESRLQLVVNW